VQVFGAQYAMRIWLNPEKLVGYRMTPLDVQQAVVAQNAQVSVGEFGGAPAVKGQALNATITAQSRLSTPGEFEAILLRVNPDGSQVRLRDVARVELTGENFSVESFYNGSPSSGLGIRLAAGANALATSDAVKQRLVELSATFPPGLEVAYPVDSTPFVRISIEEVVKTLLEAIALVFIVMLVFLQNIRATLIPTLAVPVVARHVRRAGGVRLLDQHVDPVRHGARDRPPRRRRDRGRRERRARHARRAPVTEGSHAQVDAADHRRVVGIALVLSAVFIPMRSSGVRRRDLSPVLESRSWRPMTLSVIVARVHAGAVRHDLEAAQGRAAPRLLWSVQRGYDATNRGYIRVRGVFIRALGHDGRVSRDRRRARAAVPKMRRSFLPEEDQGLLNAQVLLPPGATQEQTREIMERITKHFLENEKDAVEDVMAITGFGFGGRGQNVGLAFIKLRDWRTATARPCARRTSPRGRWARSRGSRKRRRSRSHLRRSRSSARSAGFRSSSKIARASATTR
jgi:HAE1 family hydrophobic/amphiphilic exporter-1/multidrug efflux pump